MLTNFPRTPQRSAVIARLAVSLALLLLCNIHFCAVALATPAAPDRRAELMALRDADSRIGEIFWRLSADNVALCEGAVPAIGVVWHARSSYEGAFRDAAQQYFGFDGEAAAEVVFPGGPADQGGMQANDTLIAIDGETLADDRGPSAVAGVDAAIIRAGLKGAIALRVSRHGKTVDLTIHPRLACPGRIELKVSSSSDAGTDGAVIQIATGLFNAVPDDAQLAAVVAHEYSHLILHHPERLTAAGIDRGLLAMFGRSRRLIRRTEMEADRLSIYLMYNANFDPYAAGRFWRGEGRKISPGIFSDGTHLGWEARARMLDGEAAVAERSGKRPVIPQLLMTRDQPLK